MEVCFETICFACSNFLFKPIGHLLIMIWRSILRQLDRTADDAFIIIQMSGSVGRVIYATNTILKDTSVKCMKLGCAVPAFPLGPQCPHSQALFTKPVRAEKNITQLPTGFEPTTFPPEVRSADHYATEADVTVPQQ